MIAKQRKRHDGQQHGQADDDGDTHIKHDSDNDEDYGDDTLPNNRSTYYDSDVLVMMMVEAIIKTPNILLRFRCGSFG